MEVMPLIEVNLSPKQKAFADYYIEFGVAEEAALKAGYSKAYARGKSYTMLANVGIKAYIDKRLEELKSKRVADQQEILEALTSVLRGEATAATLKGVGFGEETIEEEMPPTMQERIKAAELLGKRYGMWVDKSEVNATLTPVFVDDISGDTNA